MARIITIQAQVSYIYSRNYIEIGAIIAISKCSLDSPHTHGQTWLLRSPLLHAHTLSSDSTADSGAQLPWQYTVDSRQFATELSREGVLSQIYLRYSCCDFDVVFMKRPIKQKLGL